MMCASQRTSESITDGGVIWDLQRDPSDKVYMRENEFEYSRQPLENDQARSGSQKVGRYGYPDTTDLLTWVIN